MDFVRPIESVIPGAQGRLLAALAHVSGPLTLRGLAEVAGVSAGQCSKVLGDLVSLGLVERVDVPPAAHFRLARDHVAAMPLLKLSDVRDSILQTLERSARGIRPAPVSVIVFGSLVRGEARTKSDIDVVIVRASDIEPDNDQWRGSVARWIAGAERASGNVVSVVEVDDGEARTRLRRGGGVWTAIRNEGRVVYGLTVDELRGVERGAKRSNAKRDTR